MRQHQSLLEYKNGRHLKLAIGLCVPAIGAYVWHEPPTVYLKPYGGTWLGFAATDPVPAAFRAGPRPMSISCWSSSPTLHTAFELGWNVHRAAYALMVRVIDSGFIGASPTCIARR